MFSNLILNSDNLFSSGMITAIVLIVGIVITISTIYVFYYISNDLDSLLDKRRKKKFKSLQEKKIARLYPKSK